MPSARSWQATQPRSPRVERTKLLLVSEQVAANAVFDFLIDLMQVQRALIASQPATALRLLTDSAISIGSLSA